MAEYGILSNCGIFAGGYNITGLSNAVNLVITPDIRDRTCFGDLGRVRAYGMEDMALTVAGFRDMTAGANDEMMRAAWENSSQVPVSLFIPATSGAAVVEGDLAYFFASWTPQYVIGGAHGDDLMFNFAAQNGPVGYPCAIGLVLNPGLTAVTEDGNTTGVNLGAVATGQYAYAILHVTEVSADDSIVVSIESAATDEFIDPTTKFLFDSADAISSQFPVRIAGPITDAYWRAVHNVTGESVSIKYACALAKGK